MELGVLSIRNSTLLFTAFFLLVEAIGNKVRISLKNTFPIDVKKTGKGLRKIEKENVFN